MIGTAVAVVAALAFTLGALLIGLQLLRRWTGHVQGGPERLPVQMLQRNPVGPKQSIGLLRVGERVLVLSMADNRMELLTELTDGDRNLALAEPVERKTIAAASFRRLLRAAGVAALVFVAFPHLATAQAGATNGPATEFAPFSVDAPQFEVQLGTEDSELKLSGTVGIVVFMGALTLLPALFLLMTSFTRILIVLHFIRSAVGTPTAPPSQLLIVIAVVLTGMVMMPVLNEANDVALQPYLQGQINQQEAYNLGIQPFRQFMLANTRNQELSMFTELTGSADAATLEEIPTLTIISSFVTSELKTAFQMGFVVFLPFIVIDIVVAAVLMSMGMFMLPPVMVSLPFKLMLFVLADGWMLVIQNVVTSFRV